MTTSRSEADRFISIVAAVIEDKKGFLLLVRKAATSAFMLPGGKMDRHESPLEALQRELSEELGCGTDGEAHWLGDFTALAANEPGYRVQAKIFVVRLNSSPEACAEIAELRWFDPHTQADFPLAPLARDHVVPMILQRRKAA